MSFDAGSVIGHIRLDSSDFVKGASTVNKHTGSMTGSMFKAQLAYDLFRKAVSMVANVLKDSVKKYVEQEKVTAQLEAVLKSTGHAAGITKKEILNMASAFQKTTTFGDEAIISAQNLLLTFTKIGKDIFPQATETILNMSQALGQDLKSSSIQLGKALQDPILGVTALRRVGVNFNEAQTEVIKNLVKTGNAAEAQRLILKELEVEFGGSARAARDTFGGALKALNNAGGDLQETFGQYIATAGKPFVENMISMTEGINAFLMSEKGMQQIQDILVPLTGTFAVAFDMAKRLFDILSKFVGGVLDNLGKGFSDIVGKGNEANVVFNILGGVLKIVSTAFAIGGKFIDIWIQYIVLLVKTVGDSANTLKTFGEAMLDPLNPAKWQKTADAGKAVLDNFANFGKTVFKDVGDIITTTKDAFKDFTTDAQTNGKALKDSWDSSTKAITAGMNNLRAGLKETADETGNISLTVADKFKSWADAHGITMEKIKKQTQQTTEELKEYWKGVGDIMNRAFDEAFSAITNTIAGYYDNQLVSEDNDYKRKKDHIEQSVTDEKEREKQLAKLEKEHAAKVAEIKKKAFEAEKTANIIGTVISTARGVAEAIGMAHLFPYNFILAGIIAASGIAQVATIAAQPTPEFAGGTGMSTYTGLALVGEKGPELINFNKPAQIFSANDTSKALGGGIKQENNFYGDINSDIDLDRASAKQARNLRTLLRAS